MAAARLPVDDLSYLFTRLPESTKEMLRLAGRNKPELLTMYNLRHSLIACQGADAAIKIHQVGHGSNHAPPPSRPHHVRLLSVPLLFVVARFPNLPIPLMR